MKTHGDGAKLPQIPTHGLNDTIMRLKGTSNNVCGGVFFYLFTTIFTHLNILK